MREANRSTSKGSQFFRVFFVCFSETLVHDPEVTRLLVCCCVKVNWEVFCSECDAPSAPGLQCDCKVVPPFWLIYVTVVTLSKRRRNVMLVQYGWSARNAAAVPDNCYDALCPLLTNCLLFGSDHSVLHPSPWDGCIGLWCHRWDC